MIACRNRRGHRAAALLMAAFLLLACAALLRGGGRLYFGPPVTDLTYQFYPWRVFLSRWLARGIIPWWDPHVFGGYPVLEMQQMALFNPVSLLTALWLPPELSLNVMMAVHVVLGGACTWLALRHALRVPGWAALAGSVVYVFNGAYATRVCAGHFTVVAACAVVPLGVAGVWRAVRGVCAEPGLARGLCSPGAGVWLAAAAVANAFCVLAGSPQYVVYLIWMEVLACAAAAWRQPRAGVAVFALAWGVAALISAPQWLPTLSYLPFSGRSQMSGAMGFVLAFDFRTMLAELLFAFPLGDDVLSGHLHAKNVWETAGYPGALALVLAGALVLDPRTYRRGVCHPRLMALLLIALGFYLAHAGWLPGFGSFREPLKARAIIVTGLALAAALEVGSLLVAVRRGGRALSHAVWRSGAVAALLAAVAGAAAAVILRDPAGWGVHILSQQAPFDPAAFVVWQEMKRQPEAVGHQIAAAALRTLAVALAGLLLLALLPRRPRVLLPLLVVAACAEPAAVHLRCFVSRHPYEAAGLPRAMAEFIAPRLAETREAGRPPWRVAMPNLLANLTHHLDDFAEVAGYDPLMPLGANNRQALHGMIGRSLTRDIIREVARAQAKRFDLSKWDAGLGEPLTTATALEVLPDAALLTIERQVTAGAPSLDFYGPHLDGTHFLVTAPFARREVSADRLPPDIVRAISDIARTAREDGATTMAAGEVLRMVPARTPHRYEVAVHLRSPAAVLLRSTWLPGWRVRVDDGPPQRPLCANHWMPAVLVPAGRHTVTFEYRPENFTMSLVLSVCGLTMLAGLLARVRQRRRAA